MADIIGRPTVQLHVAIQLTEMEARAIDALVGYGDDAFIKHFYDGLGKSYMDNYEGGLRSFFKSMREKLPGLLSKADNARKVFHDPIPAHDPATAIQCSEARP
jgi:hypothetical protein